MIGRGPPCGAATTSVAAMGRREGGEPFAGEFGFAAFRARDLFNTRSASMSRASASVVRFWPISSCAEQALGGGDTPTAGVMGAELDAQRLMQVRFGGDRFTDGQMHAGAFDGQIDDDGIVGAEGGAGDLMCLVEGGGGPV